MARPGQRETENPWGASGPHRAAQVQNIRALCRRPARPTPRSGPCDPPRSPLQDYRTDTVAGDVPCSGPIEQGVEHQPLRANRQGMTLAAEDPLDVGNCEAGPGLVGGRPGRGFDVGCHRQGGQGGQRLRRYQDYIRKHVGIEP